VNFINKSVYSGCELGYSKPKSKFHMIFPLSIVDCHTKIAGKLLY